MVHIHLATGVSTPRDARRQNGANSSGNSVMTSKRMAGRDLCGFNNQAASPR